MKKIYFALAALATIFAGCSKEVDIDEPVVSAEKAVTLKASIGDPATRVSSDNAGIFKWQSTDEITVVTNSYAIRQFTIGQITDGTSAEFSGNIPANDEIRYALYPASQSHKASSTQITFHLDDNIVWKADASNMPMLATVGKETSFDAVGGVLKLILFNIPADADYLKFSATSKKITGDFAVSNSKIVTEANTDSNNELVINFKDSYNASKVFYIPLPTGTIDGFTVALYETLTDAEPLFSVTSTKSLSIAANKLIIAPVMNCAKETVLWSEDFTQYSANDVPGSVSGESYHGATGYTCVKGNSDTKIYDDALAGGTKPELLINKYGGSFKASGIPTNGAASMTLSFKVNNTISVSATSGITVGSVATGSGTKTVTLTNTNNLTSFDLTFSNSSSNNVRIDDISVVIPGAAFSVPSITADDEELTIAVSEDLSASTGVTLANAVDGLGISYKITYPDENEWIKSVAINNGTLTVTANDTNSSAAAYTATISLMASGATSKMITVTQESALVPNPTNLAAVAGDATVDITWTGNANASSYVAYLHTAATEDPATGGTDISSSITHDGQAYIIGDYTNVVNNQTYYVYVKVNGVAENYVAPTGYVVTTFTPALAKGTAENPYTVAEALENTPSSGTSDNVYIHGIVSSFQNTSIVGDGTNYRYYISDDGKTTNQLLVYKGRGLNNQAFSNADDLLVGDEVTIYGGLTTYNNTKEVAANNYLVSLVHKCKTPTFSPAGGTFYLTQHVVLNSDTFGATIYYTTDGQVPTTESSVYSEAIEVSETTTIKAIAVKENYLTSEVAEAEYNIEAATKLGTPVISVESYTHNSITFSWEAINHATGYKVSTDNGSTWSETQQERTYTWSGLNASTSYTIQVKAIGTSNGQYTDSDIASKSQTTAAPITLTSLTVDTSPTKVAYYTTDTSIDLTGAVITAHYSNNSTANVTTSCVVTNTSDVLGSAGNNKDVIVSYTEGSIVKTATFKVNVSAGPTVLYLETFGSTTSNTALSLYTGWSWSGTNHPSGSNWSVTRNNLSETNLSTGAYDGASGLSHMSSVDSGASAVINFGNVSSYSNVVLSFGWANNAGKNKDRTMTVEVSGNGGTSWTSITFTTSANAQTNDGFHLCTYNVNDNDRSNFSVRFTNTSNNTSRIDDVKLVGTPSTTGGSGAPANTNIAPVADKPTWEMN